MKLSNIQIFFMIAVFSILSAVAAAGVTAAWMFSQQTTHAAFMQQASNCKVTDFCKIAMYDGAQLVQIEYKR